MKSYMSIHGQRLMVTQILGNENPFRLPQHKMKMTILEKEHVPTKFYILTILF